MNKIHREFGGDHGDTFETLDIVCGSEVFNAFNTDSVRLSDLGINDGGTISYIRRPMTSWEREQVLQAEYEDGEGDRYAEWLAEIES